MNNLLSGNKILIMHVVSEIIVLVAMVFYFSRQNRKLQTYIEDLAQRIEDQEDHIKKMDKMLRDVVNHINQQKSMHQQKSMYQQNKVSVPKKILVRKVKKKREKPTTITQKIIKIDEGKEEFSDSDNDSDLDAEIAEELKDLTLLKKD